MYRRMRRIFRCCSSHGAQLPSCRFLTGRCTALPPPPPPSLCRCLPALLRLAPSPVTPFRLSPLLPALSALWETPARPGASVGKLPFDCARRNCAHKPSYSPRRPAGSLGTAPPTAWKNLVICAFQRRTPIQCRMVLCIDSLPIICASSSSDSSPAARISRRTSTAYIAILPLYVERKAPGSRSACTCLHHHCHSAYASSQYDTVMSCIRNSTFRCFPDTSTACCTSERRRCFVSSPLSLAPLPCTISAALKSATTHAVASPTYGVGAVPAGG